MSAEQRRPEQEADTRDPEEIHRDIERARGEVGETVAAIAARTDVKSQARDKVEEVKGQAATAFDRVKVPAAIFAALLALLIVRRVRSG